jgi:hypothetical protein
MHLSKSSPTPQESSVVPDTQPQAFVNQPAQVAAAPAVPAKTWNTASQKPAKSLAEVMREQEEEDLRRRLAAAEQAQQEMASSSSDSRGGVWSSKSAVAPVPLKEIMMQQQKTAADSTSTPKSSDSKPTQEHLKHVSQPQQPMSLKQIQAEQLRAAEQEKQARAQQKATPSAPAVVHVPVAVIAPKEALKESPKTPVSSKGKQTESPKASASGVWGAPAVTTSLKDIQAEQLRLSELQKEQQRAQQQAQRATASSSFANIAASAPASQPMSLREIQAEELRSKQMSQRVVSATPSLPPPSAAVPPAPSANASQLAANVTSVGGGTSTSKKSQTSASASPAPVAAPPPVDDDDMVWDYSSKPAAKAPVRYAHCFVPVHLEHTALYLSTLSMRMSFSCCCVSINNAVAVPMSKLSRRKARDFPRKRQRTVQLQLPRRLEAPACPTSSKCGALLKCSR